MLWGPMEYGNMNLIYYSMFFTTKRHLLHWKRRCNRTECKINLSINRTIHVLHAKSLSTKSTIMSITKCYYTGIFLLPFWLYNILIIMNICVKDHQACCVCESYAYIWLIRLWYSSSSIFGKEIRVIELWLLSIWCNTSMSSIIRDNSIWHIKIFS